MSTSPDPSPQFSSSSGNIILSPNTTFLVFCGKNATSISLQKLETLVGRNDTSNITVDLDLALYENYDAPLISRQHALFQWVERGLELIDLGSRNGT